MVAPTMEMATSPSTLVPPGHQRCPNPLGGLEPDAQHRSRYHRFASLCRLPSVPQFPHAAQGRGARTCPPPVSHGCWGLLGCCVEQRGRPQPAPPSEGCRDAARGWGRRGTAVLGFGGCPVGKAAAGSPPAPHQWVMVGWKRLGSPEGLCPTPRPQAPSPTEPTQACCSPKPSLSFPPLPHPWEKVGNEANRGLSRGNSHTSPIPAEQRRRGTEPRGGEVPGDRDPPLPAPHPVPEGRSRGRAGV